MTRIIRNLKELKEYESFISENKYVIIKIGAEWCDPCENIKELFDSLTITMPKEYAVGLIDIDQLPRIKRKLNVNNIPFFANIINGEVKDVLVGSGPKEINSLFNKCKKRLEQN